MNEEEVDIGGVIQLRAAPLAEGDDCEWELGRGWFTTGAMLARMNFASTLTTNQKFNLREAFRGKASTPDALVESAFDRVSTAPFTTASRSALIDYINAGAPYTGTDAQLANKGAGVVHLIVGSGEYQLI